MADAAHEQEAVGGGRGGDEAAHLVLGLGSGLGLGLGIGLALGLGFGDACTRRVAKWISSHASSPKMCTPGAGWLGG